MRVVWGVLLACDVAGAGAAGQVVATLSDAAIAAQVPVVETYHGICDASAAVVLRDGRIAIANDEDNIIRVYETGSPDVKASVDLTPVLDVNAKRPEADIEAATRVGDEVYWITSHGRNRSGKYRESRYQFFRTTLPPAGAADFDIAASTVASKTFLVDLNASPTGQTYGLEAASQLAPGTEGGFNIEGLSVMPSGSVLVGLRSPVPAGKALLVQVDNPADVVAGKSAAIGTEHRLDLDGHGIRSIEYVPALGKYVLVAGCPDDTCDWRQRPSKLYTWDPKTDELKEMPVDLSALNAEGLVYDEASGELLVISDDGSRLIGGERCKDLDSSAQQFRILRFKLQ